MNNDVKAALAMIFFIIALAITGTHEFDAMKLAERNACSVNPSPEWCDEH